MLLARSETSQTRIPVEYGIRSVLRRSLESHLPGLAGSFHDEELPSSEHAGGDPLFSELVAEAG
jgi:hypothetical protein